jgi:flagellar hook-basal body complex protein FliE
MSINQIKNYGIKGFESPQPRSKIEQGTDEKGESFSQVLADALKEMEKIGGNADREGIKLATGTSDNPHDAMIAMEKADVAFQLMNAVRTKVVRAYEEVMRMQV